MHRPWSWWSRHTCRLVVNPERNLDVTWPCIAVPACWKVIICGLHRYWQLPSMHPQRPGMTNGRAPTYLYTICFCHQPAACQLPISHAQGLDVGKVGVHLLTYILCSFGISLLSANCLFPTPTPTGPGRGQDGGGQPVAAAGGPFAQPGLHARLQADLQHLDPSRAAKSVQIAIVPLHQSITQPLASAPASCIAPSI